MKQSEILLKRIKIDPKKNMGYDMLEFKKRFVVGWRYSVRFGRKGVYTDYIALNPEHIKNVIENGSLYA